MQLRNSPRKLLFSLFPFIFSLAHAQVEKKIDSLQVALKNATEDTVKRRIYDAIGYYYITFDLAQSLQNYRNALELEGDSSKEKVNTLRKMGNAYFHHMIYEKALEYYLQSLKVSTDIGDRAGMAASFGNMGNVYAREGDLSGNRSDYEKSIEFQTKAMEIRKALGDYDNLNNCILNIGNAYMGLGQEETALQNYQSALKRYEESEDHGGIDLARINIAEAYLALGNKTHNKSDYEKAKEYFLERLSFYKDVNSQTRALLLKDLGEVYLREGNFPLAISYLEQALEMGKSTHETEVAKNAAKFLAELYGKKGDFKKAFEYGQLCDALKDSLITQQKTSDMTRMQIAFDTEEKESQIKLLETNQKMSQLEIAKSNADIDRQRTIIIASFIAVFLLAGLVFLLFNRYKLKQQANDKIAAAYNLIERKNIQITDSINYAKRIQDSILPSEEMLRDYFPDSFIFYQPRDIVSGDFYWFSERAGKIIIAVADCTGHGVPGAFMSMIGNTILNEIVNEGGILDPAEILTHLDKDMSSSLRQGNSLRNGQEDGMDISICVINKKQMQLEFAAANHSLFLFQSGKSEIIYGDIYSIGGIFGKGKKVFTKRTIQLQDHCSLFMSTDGYADQFGGEQHKKFMLGKFEEMLANIASEPASEQKKRMQQAFQSWKGETKQLDDVLVIGIKV